MAGAAAPKSASETNDAATLSNRNKETKASDERAAAALSDSQQCSAAAAQQDEATLSVAVVVEGASRVQVGRAVEQVLGKRYKVIPAKRYNVAARRLRARQMKDRQVAKVADKLGASAVVHGVVKRKKGKRFELNVSVRDGATGAAIEQFVVPLRARRVAKGTRLALAERLYPAIGCRLASKAPQISSDNKTRVAAKEAPASKRAPEPKVERDVAERVVVHVDDSGQVMDDEVPAILSAR